MVASARASYRHGETTTYRRSGGVSLLVTDSLLSLPIARCFGVVVGRPAEGSKGASFASYRALAYSVSCSILFGLVPCMHSISTNLDA